jgi:hypothetical protein
MTNDNKGWVWWAGDSDEWLSSGPHATREEAIAEATGECIGEFQDEKDDSKWKLGFHIVEARQDPLRLADWIRADTLLERADEDISDSDRISSEHEEGPWFEATPEQEADLAARVKAACDEWQAAHGLTFKTQTFSATRNREYVVVDHPANEEAA